MILLFNVLLNLLQLFLLYKLSGKFFNKESASIAVILYIFYFNNMGLVLANYTELLFGVLTLGGLLFYFKTSGISQFASGLLIGASITVRPLGWALIASIIVYYIYSKIKKRETKNILQMVSGCIIFILLFGGFSYSHFGRFVFTSTTGPVNMLIGANDDATGGFKDDVFDKGNAGYIANPDSMTYYEKNDFYKNAAVNWIQSHPLKWIGLIPLKLVHTFIWDDIAISNLVNSGRWDFARLVKYVVRDKSIAGIMPSAGCETKILFFTAELYQLLYYYFILVMIITGTVNYFKSNTPDYGKNIILLYTLFCIIIILVTVGNVRYKYPFIIPMMMFASYHLYQKYFMKNEDEFLSAKNGGSKILSN